MKRSNFIFNIISVAVLAALVVYIAFSYVSARKETLTTEKTTADVAESLLSTTGVILRDEVSLGETNACFTVQDGEKVAKGEKIAEQYQDVEALERANEIRTLSLQIESLEEESDMLQTDQRVKAEDSVEKMVYAFRTGDTDQLDSSVLQVRTYAFEAEGSSTDNREEQLQTLRTKLAELRQADLSDGSAVTAPCSGTFCAMTDGLESLSPAAAMTMTPSQFQTAADQAATGKTTSGKIITSLRWYYVTAIPLENCQQISVGETVKVRFIHTYSSTVNMTVESLSQAEDGSCLAVLSADRELSETVNLREVMGQMIFSQQDGLRVSRKALHLDEDGRTLVYVLEGTKAVSVPVNVLAELEDGDYLVESLDSADLHAGAEVIVQGRDLYDDKVVLQ